MAVTRLAAVLFVMQLVGLGLWSTLLYQRFSLTHDGAEVLQLLYQTAHGHPGAYSTIDRYPGWRDHFTVMYWPLALLDLVPPRGIWVLWAQDAALVAAEVVAFAWMRHLVMERRPEEPGPWWPVAVLGLGCLVLVANPWTYWAASWDLHSEPFAAPFVVAAAFDFSRGRNGRAWCWVALTLLWGDVMATWVIGLGLSAFVAFLVTRQRGLRRTAGLLVVAGVGWLALAALLGGDRGSLVVASSGYVAGGGGARASFSITWSRFVTTALGHPTQALRTLAGHWPNVASVIGPTAWIGILTSWTIGVPSVVILENNLSGFGLGVFSNPGYQSAPIFALSAVGLVVIMLWLVRRWRLRAVLTGALAAVVAINVAVWAVIWIPQAKADWLRVSSVQAAVLNRALAEIPAGDEVVASQGIVGRFADRDRVYDLGGGSNVIPVTGSTVWFVVAPTVGIEDEPVNGAQGALATLADFLGARLVTGKDGIWVFRWQRAPDVHELSFPAAVEELPAWVSPGVAGRAVRNGAVPSWHVEATGRSGYIVSGDYWQRQGGDYQVQVSLVTAVPTWVEVWDDNDHDLLAREAVPPTGHVAQIFFPLAVPSAPAGAGAYGGVPPFTMQRVPPVPGQTLEIRIWYAGDGQARIDRLELRPAQQDFSTTQS